MRLKKNDTVKVMAGKDKGATGKIVEIDYKNQRVVVQGVNMVSKTMKKKSEQDKGGIMKIEAPLHVSNLAFLTGGKNGNVSRIGYRFDENGKKVRFAKKTGEVL